MGADRTIIHVDMDAFYAAVEVRDDPSLAGKPLIIGGGGNRGVVSTCSYEARAFGVHSAQSMVIAMRRCPQAVVVSSRISHYAEVSRQIFAIFERYTPLVEGISLDEAFLDVSGSRKAFGTSVAIAKEIKAAIKKELKLTASAGVATSRCVANIASDLDKPDGLVVVAAEGTKEFLAPLPVSKMWGIGKKSLPKLEALGIKSFADLRDTKLEVLQPLFGKSAMNLQLRAAGIDDRPVVSERNAKSIGSENTFGNDFFNAEDLERYFLMQSMNVAGRLQRAALWAKTVTIKLKYGNHQLVSRQKQLSSPSQDTDALYGAALLLLKQVPDLKRGVRLTGVSASGLTEIEPLPTLFDGNNESKRRADRVRIELEGRFGAGVVTRATLLGTKVDTHYGGVEERPMSPGQLNHRNNDKEK